MINSTSILQNLEAAQIKDTSTILMKSALRVFVDHPIWTVGGVFLGFAVLAVGLKNILDVSEGKAQKNIWISFVFAGIVTVTFVGLVLLDSGESVVMNKISFLR